MYVEVEQQTQVAATWRVASVRRAYQDVGWVLSPGGALAGLSLGFDRRAEHVQGIAPLLEKLGVEPPPYQDGLLDRQVSHGLPALHYSVYDASPISSTRRKYPAALLVLMGPAYGEASPPHIPERELVRRFDLAFFHDPPHRLSKPEHDLVTAWGAEGFAVHARGEQNIALLGQLYQALLSRDVAVVAPTRPGSGPGPVRLLRVSQVSSQDQAQMVAFDQETAELATAVAQLGVYEQIAQADLHYVALMPAWLDDAKDEIIFYLEPAIPNEHNTGWFSLEEIRQWAARTGPVMRDSRLDRQVWSDFNGDWQSRLYQGLAAIGAKPAYGVQLAWLDAEQYIPALRYRATRDTENVLPSGTYSFSFLMKRYAEPMAGPERRQPAPTPPRAATRTSFNA